MAAARPFLTVLSKPLDYEQLHTLVDRLASCSLKLAGGKFPNLGLATDAFEQVGTNQGIPRARRWPLSAGDQPTTLETRRVRTWHRESTKGSMVDVRDSIKRIRGEGERFLGQLRRETQTFARKTRAEVVTDVRKVRDDLPKVRGERALRDLETRGRRVVATLEKQMGQLADAAGKQLDPTRGEELPGSSSASTSSSSASRSSSGTCRESREQQYVRGQGPRPRPSTLGAAHSSAARMAAPT